MNFIIWFIYFSFWLLLFISLVFLIIKAEKKNILNDKDKEINKVFSYSKDHVISQFFLILSFLFGGFTLFSFNRDFGYLLSSPMVIFILSIIGLFSSYFWKSNYILAFTLFGILTWWTFRVEMLTLSEYNKMMAVLFGLFTLGLIYVSLSNLHEKIKKFNSFSFIYQLMGIITIILIMFFISTKPGLVLIQEYSSSGQLIFFTKELTLTFLFFVLILVGMVIYLAIKRLINPLELFIILILAYLAIISTVLPTQQIFIDKQKTYYLSKNLGNLIDDINFNYTKNGVILLIVVNIIVFFKLISLFFIGYIRKKIWLINF